MHILIADNAREVTDLLRDFLSQRGHRIDVAFDGKKAMDMLDGNSYDLVFLDHDMPEITGLEIIKYIKQNKLKPKIVMITGYPTMQDFFVKTMGADEYVPKPFNLEDILAIIQKYSNHHSTK